MSKNIQMQEMTSSGYDILYPQTIAAQIEDVYSKDETVSAATKALYNLGADAVPDDVLSTIGRLHGGLGNEYVWEKVKKETTYSFDATGDAWDSYNCVLVDRTTSNWPNVIKYGNSVIVNDNNKFELVNQQTLEVTTSNLDDLTIYDVLKGKYLLNVTRYGSSFSFIFKVEETGTFSWSGSYLRNPTTVRYTNPKKNIISTSFGYVNSPDRNAYPPAVDDGFTYEYRGQIGGGVQIETGGYVGTGTYGKSNPNSLTFGFEPIAILLFGMTPSISNGVPNEPSAVVPTYMMPANNTYYYGGFEQASQSRGEVKKSIDGKTIAWYSTSASYQHNASGYHYYYIAIG